MTLSELKRSFSKKLLRFKQYRSGTLTDLKELLFVRHLRDECYKETDTDKALELLLFMPNVREAGYYCKGLTRRTRAFGYNIVRDGTPQELMRFFYNDYLIKYKK